MSAPEFSRPVRLDTLGEGVRTIEIEAGEEERAAVAIRFGLPAIATLLARATLVRDGETVAVSGRLTARATQSCIATGNPVAAVVDEAFSLRFVPSLGEGEEIELDEGDLDTVPYDGTAIDLGEAVAQELALALDPFPRCADAEAHLRAAGVVTEEDAEVQRIDDSPFAALKGLAGK